MTASSERNSASRSRSRARPPEDRDPLWPGGEALKRGGDEITGTPPELVVASTRPLTADILAIELVSRDCKQLPPFEAGAHLNLRLPNGLIRQYSLFNAPSEGFRYCIAVKLERDGGGGSRYLHENCRLGMGIELVSVSNNFRLPNDDDPLVFIAGGIGITPIRSMICTANENERSWRLHYAALSRDHAAFADELENHSEKKLRFWFSRDQKKMNIRGILGEADPKAHILCCGPPGLLSDFREAASRWPRDHVHFEVFQPDALEQTTEDSSFELELRRSGTTLFVPSGTTVLDAILDAGIDVPFACNSGVCGTCESTVLLGQVDHRDSILSASERTEGCTMMICVSRSCGPRLVLDL